MYCTYIELYLFIIFTPLIISHFYFSLICTHAFTLNLKGEHFNFRLLSHSKMIDFYPMITLFETIFTCLIMTKKTHLKFYYQFYLKFLKHICYTDSEAQIIDRMKSHKMRFSNTFFMLLKKIVPKLRSIYEY